MPNPDTPWKWKWGDDLGYNAVMRNTQYLPMSQAGLVGRQTAKLIDDALAGAKIPGGRTDEIYQVVVISRCASCRHLADQAGLAAPTGLPDKQKILNALKIKRRVLSWGWDHTSSSELASVEPQDFALQVAGFAYTVEELADPGGPSNINFEDKDWVKMIKATKVMAKVPTNHLKFELDSRVSPVIFGGRAPDGSIVGVLTTYRV
jgi:hypothetical protein